MNDSEPLVEINHVTKQYGDFVALDDLSLQLQRGRILGFIGPNGAGKTTTIKILVGHSKPTSGSAKVAGCDCTNEAHKIKRLVGYMPDTFGSYEHMRVSEYLDFFGAAFGIPRKVRRKRIEEVMETASVTRMKDLFVESLSHGMRQRVGIARTLIHDPDLLILDEPANGLDPQARIEMRLLLLRLAEVGKTLIVTSHILPELSRICHDVAVITSGKLRAFGTLDDVLRQVHQKRVFEILVTDTSDVAEMTRLINEQPELEADVEASETESTVRFQTTVDDDSMQRLLAQAITRGLSIVQFREVQVDLEDTFMSVTKSDAQNSQSTESVIASGGGAE
ncbi:putative ABC transporter ATP-binding protein YbhF [Thalassoglobus neptunius]|uniref:Putative ABC transporter ATP-binding protein YbhF n=1 Tax=Thalassoglobus neptunius TaxID=1938619 RepID=A0A5C5W8Q3_9PLAN|nr:ABC transporter ATP-binding protein [Thalassoglobus neptunius]TWT47040.1 putative ABC transporter ATP-binding protein YbhF [Thalassoglobus neptunius]